MERRDLAFHATERWGETSAVWLRPPDADAAIVLGHGAGAGMRHAFMEAAATRLADLGVATLRYQFPYMERGSRYPDAQSVLLETVGTAIALADELAGPMPLFAAGKSMGGRMTSIAAAETPFPGLRGLVFFGFPLHAPGRASGKRADHLDRVPIPMLFLQGTRDRLADLEHLRPVCERLGDRATLHVIEDGDHSFHVLKRTGRTDEEVLDELAGTAADWMRAAGG